MNKDTSRVVWVRLQLDPGAIAFAELEWTRRAYASRADGKGKKTRRHAYGSAWSNGGS